MDKGKSDGATQDEGELGCSYSKVGTSLFHVELLELRWLEMHIKYSPNPNPEPEPNTDPIPELKHHWNLILTPTWKPSLFTETDL